MVVKQFAGVTIYLIRHGESEANLDKSINARIADHAIALSAEGHRQAADGAGRALAAMLADVPAGDGIQMYHSPYLRTEQTADAIKSALPLHVLREHHGFVDEESIFLRELEFGLFDGVPDEDLPSRFPLEHAQYEKAKRFEGEFYAQMPLGESRCRVAERVHSFFGTLHRDIERHGVRHAIIVSHGVTLRQFAMMWCKLGVRWVEREKNPANCSIRIIRGTQIDPADNGYAFKGFPPHHTPPGQTRGRRGGVTSRTGSEPFQSVAAPPEP